MGIKDIDSLTIEDIKPLTVSFKKDEDDLILYKWVLKKCRSGKSGYIKDRLRELMESEEDDEVKPKSVKPIIQSTNSLIELDF